MCRSARNDHAKNRTRTFLLIHVTLKDVYAGQGVQRS